MDKNAHQSKVALDPMSSWWLPVVLERAHRHCGLLSIPGSVAVPRRHGPMPPPAPKLLPPESRSCSGVEGCCRGALWDRTRAMANSVAAM